MIRKQIDIDRAKRVIAIVNNYFDAKKNIKGRKIGVVVPRQIAHYFVKKKLKLPYQLIGDIYNMDHATIFHSCRKIEESYIYNSEISYYLGDINKLLREDKELQEFINPIEKLDEINEINEIIEVLDVFKLRKIKEHLLAKYTKIQ